ncbi:hypothetical protein V6N13_121987 [Hibiscus sabdariffa]|uniref:Uncharacterized protein n=2 Tax=Hibiscus sabdariffa TaxID=183260 RepID=A0ABR2ADN8_9ROSI
MIKDKVTQTHLLTIIESVCRFDNVIDIFKHLFKDNNFIKLLFVWQLRFHTCVNSFTQLSVLVTAAFILSFSDLRLLISMAVRTLSSSFIADTTPWSHIPYFARTSGANGTGPSSTVILRFRETSEALLTTILIIINARTSGSALSGCIGRGTIP